MLTIFTYMCGAFTIHKWFWQSGVRAMRIAWAHGKHSTNNVEVVLKQSWRIKGSRNRGMMLGDPNLEAVSCLINKINHNWLLTKHPAMTWQSCRPTKNKKLNNHSVHHLNCNLFVLALGIAGFEHSSKGAITEQLLHMVSRMQHLAFSPREVDNLVLQTAKAS